MRRRLLTLRYWAKGYELRLACALLGHRDRPHPSGDGWRYCSRPGCSFEWQLLR